MNSDRALSQPGRKELGESLASQEYLRARLAPRWSDVGYLYFTDLLQVTRLLAARTAGAVFDYGCGGAPYRGCFGSDRPYVRADVTPGPGIDRLLPEDGMTSEPGDSYDTVLSSQVLEHVRDPVAYVAECHRILKPGGRLILTTHGMVEEHGCPHDYTRWTGRGLEELVKARGFTVEASYKVTTELRGAIQVLHGMAGHLRSRGNPLVRIPLSILRRLYGWCGIPLLNALGSRLTGQGVTESRDDVTLYFGVALLARKVGPGR